MLVGKLPGFFRVDGFWPVSMLRNLEAGMSVRPVRVTEMGPHDGWGAKHERAASWKLTCYHDRTGIWPVRAAWTRALHAPSAHLGRIPFMNSTCLIAGIKVKGPVGYNRRGGLAWWAMRITNIMPSLKTTQ